MQDLEQANSTADKLSLPSSHDTYPDERPQHHHHTASPRKVVPFSSPLSKRIRMNQSPEEQRPYQHRHTSQHHTRSPCKQQSLSLPKPINLNPCHICHRKPTKKSDLDSYADCESCGARTCYICIRQCMGRRGTPASASDQIHEHRMRDEEHDEYTDDNEDEENQRPSQRERSLCMEDAPAGEERRYCSEDRIRKGDTWSRGQGRGHWGRICSQCCVEQGPRGEVLCLGCLET